MHVGKIIILKAQVSPWLNSGPSWSNWPKETHEDPVGHQGLKDPLQNLMNILDYQNRS